MSASATATASGIGVGGLGFLILFVLKLMGQITLGWFWVLTSFLWIPLLMTLVVLAAIFVVLAIVAAFAWVFGK